MVNALGDDNVSVEEFMDLLLKGSNVGMEMKSVQFQVGQRVRYTQKSRDLTTGTVAHIISSGHNHVGVEWDIEKNHFHDCEGRCKNNRGYYVQKEYLELIDEEQPVAQPTGGVSTLKLEDLTVGLPLLGLRVMVNPKHFDRVNERLYGVSGTITNQGGAISTIRDIIRRYKRNGEITNWNVAVTFDNGRREDVRIKYLLPIANGHRDFYRVEFENGEAKTWNEEEYKKHINKYVIEQGWTLHKIHYFDDEYRQKLLDEAQ